jgi:hypothetical protein
MENPTFVERPRRVRKAAAFAWYAVLARPMLGALVFGGLFTVLHNVPQLVEDHLAGLSALLAAALVFPFHVAAARRRDDDGAPSHLQHLAAKDRAAVLCAVRRGEDVGERLAPSLLAFSLVELGEQRSRGRRLVEAVGLVMLAIGVAIALCWNLDAAARVALGLGAAVVTTGLALARLSSQERRDRHRARARRFAEDHAVVRRASARVYGGTPISRTGAWADTPLWSVVKNDERGLSRA